MTIRELISKLEEYNENYEVEVESVNGMERMADFNFMVTTYHGRDDITTTLVITTDGVKR